MNRRSFFSTLAAATAGFTILPAATTYGRIWRAEKKVKWIKNPEWDDAPYELRYIWNPEVVVNHGEVLHVARFKSLGAEGWRLEQVPHYIKA